MSGFKRPQRVVAFPENADYLRRSHLPVANVFTRLPAFVDGFTGSDERGGVLRCRLCGHRARLRHPNNTRRMVAPAEIDPTLRTLAKHVSAKHSYGEDPAVMDAAWNWLIRRGYQP